MGYKVASMGYKVIKQALCSRGKNDCIFIKCI